MKTAIVSPAMPAVGARGCLRPEFLLVLGILTTCSSAGAVTYGVTDLGTLGGDASALGINDNGQIVGHSIAADGAPHAFIYSGKTMVDLGAMPGGDFGPQLGASYGFAINASGDVVGTVFAQEPSHDLRAFLFSGGMVSALGTLRNIVSEAYAINDRGQVVGGADIGGGIGATRAFLYSSGEVMDLGTLGGAFSVAQGINASGAVVGYSAVDTPDLHGTDVHAFLYSGGIMRDLGTLGGTGAPGDEGSKAYAINDLGQVVGEAKTADGAHHAFLYSGGTMIDLGPPPVGAGSVAFAINNKGQVVGAPAFLYDGGRIQPLVTLMASDSEWEVGGPAGINNLGQIAATGSRRDDPSHQYHAVLLTVTSQENPPTTTTLPPDCHGGDPFTCVQDRLRDLSNVTATMVESQKFRKFLVAALGRARSAVRQAENNFFNDKFGTAIGELRSAIKTLRKFRQKLDSPKGQRLTQGTRDLLGATADSIRAAVVHLRDLVQSER